MTNEDPILDSAAECHTAICWEEAVVKVYWLGFPALGLCQRCATKALSVANSLGFHLVIEPVNKDTNLCVRSKKIGVCPRGGCVDVVMCGRDT